MKLFDLLSLVLDNLARRKARVALTAVGVIIGTAAVVVLVSLATGLQRNATEQLAGIGDLTLINVFPSFGGGPGPIVISEPGGPGGGPKPQAIINDEAIESIQALPGVTAVIPRDYLQAGAWLEVGQLQGGGGILGIPPEGVDVLGLKAAQGEVALARNTIIAGSQIATAFFPKRFRPGAQAPPLPDLFDKTLKLILTKFSQDGVEVRKTLQVRVVAVLQQTGGEPDYSIYMPLDQVTSFNEWALGKKINRNRDGYQQLAVKASGVDKVLDIADAIKALGFEAFSPQSFVQGINGFFLVLQVIFGGVGAIALLVAAIGIANTMAMAVLERTREIGLMKAVGATNRDVLAVFLGEAGGIGLVGGLGGVALGWGAGQIINVVALAFLAGQAAQNGGPPPSIAVYTPAWLPIFAIVFASIIGILSGLYPALRAATLNPMEALKYE
ncbi:MAG: ABC transporter permease [Anaerolineae bacterium]